MLLSPRETVNTINNIHLADFRFLFNYYLNVCSFCNLDKMFKRKLKALNYVDWDKVNSNNKQHVKKLVPWLEDQKIRHYKIEDRKALQNINSDSWDDAFQKYLEDIGCPFFEDQADKVEWLLGLAVRLEFDDNSEKYKKIVSNKSKNKTDSAPSIKSSNPLDNIDFQSKDFKEGVNSIARLLSIPLHPNHLITLEACSKLICQRLNPNAVQNPNSVIVRGKPYPFLEASNRLNMGDAALNKAAKVLSLLYIQDLRNLQTQINEAIVSVQSITANPKTDTKLGRVGR